MTTLQTFEATIRVTFYLPVDMKLHPSIIFINTALTASSVAFYVPPGGFSLIE